MTNTPCTFEDKDESLPTPEEVAERNDEQTRLTREERMSCDNARLAMMAHDFDEIETFEDRYREVKVDLAGCRQDLKNKAIPWKNKRELAKQDLAEIKEKEKILWTEYNEERRGSEQSDLLAIKKLCGLPMGYLFV